MPGNDDLKQAVNAAEAETLHETLETLVETLRRQEQELALLRREAAEAIALAEQTGRESETEEFVERE